MLPLFKSFGLNGLDVAVSGCKNAVKLIKGDSFKNNLLNCRDVI